MSDYWFVIIPFIHAYVLIKVTIFILANSVANFLCLMPLYKFVAKMLQRPMS